MPYSHICSLHLGRILPVFAGGRVIDAAVPARTGGKRKLDSYELMGFGLDYIARSSRLMAELPRDYWPSGENLAARRQALLRARVLLDVGEQICQIATDAIIEEMGGAANENRQAA